MKKTLILLAMITLSLLTLGHSADSWSAEVPFGNMSTAGYRLSNGGMSSLGGSMTDGGNVIATSNMYPSVAAPTGGLSLSPETATFAATNRDTQSAPMTFTLANDGAIAVTVSAITLGGPFNNQFSVATGGLSACTSLTPTLMPGTSCTVNVIFAPTGTGAMSATLQVISDDATNPSMSAALSGTAVLPVTFTIGTAVTGSGGSISCDTPVDQGTSSTCTITPETGYSLATLTDNSADVKNQVIANSYSIINVTANHTVAGTFVATTTIDTTPPVVSAGANQTKGAQFTQTGTASDASTMTFAWSKQAGPGTITFSTTTALATAISASTNGTYTIRLTATDVAGNSAFSDMTLIWDTSVPTKLPDGDLNNDGTVTVADALRALQITVGLITSTATDFAKGDVAPLVSNKPAPDGKINTGDAVVILGKIVGSVSW